MPQGRDPQAHRAIVQATLDVLGEVGYGRLTIEGVAARAGVGKTTIYRWWPSKFELTLEAVSNMLDLGPARNSGNSRDDLAGIAREVAAMLSDRTAASVIAALAADFARDPGLAEAQRERLVRPRWASDMEAIERAVERGDLPPDVDRRLVIDLLVAPLFYRAFITGEPVERDLPRKLADLLLHGELPRARR